MNDPFPTTPRCEWPSGCERAGQMLVTGADTNDGLLYVGKRFCSPHSTQLDTFGGLIYAETDVEVPVCDFCAAPWPQWALYCDEFTADLLIASRVTEDTSTLTNIMSSVWGACDDCRSLLEARDREGLITRVAEVHASPDMRSLLDEFYGPVFATMQLPLRHEPAVARPCINCGRAYTRQRDADSVCDACGCVEYDTAEEDQ